MRLDTPVYFQLRIAGEYDKTTGDYKEDTITEEKVYADVTNSGIETVRLIYGELKQGSLTIRLQTPYKKPYDSIRIGTKIYHVDFARPLRNKAVFVVSEVQ